MENATLYGLNPEETSTLCGIWSAAAQMDAETRKAYLAVGRTLKEADRIRRIAEDYGKDSA